MSRLTVGLEPGDEFEQRVRLSSLKPYALVDLTELSVMGEDPAQLERIGELFIEAGRDLRMAIVAENEKRAANFLDSDDTTAMARRFAAQKAEREARKTA